MCGRYAIKNPTALKEAFNLVEMPELKPRYNIAPTQDVPIIRFAPGGRRLSLALWGLIPAWSKPTDKHYSTINARAETVESKPAFRHPFKHHRCLIPADGFYEWHEEGGIKRPHHISRRDGAPFAMAGLWDIWPGPEGEVLSCSIIVTSANQFMRPLHERMPVILDARDYDAWLDPDNHDTARLKQLLVPAPEDLLTEWEVSRALNNPRHEGAECAQPIEK